MGAVDYFLLTAVALGDAALMLYLHRRRVRRIRSEQMLRSLRAAVDREIGAGRIVEIRRRAALVLRRAG